MPAKLRRAYRAPGDAIAGAIETTERAFQAFNTGQQCIFTDHHIVHNNLPRHGSAQAQLAFDSRRGETFHALFQYKAADRTAMRLGFGPDHK